MKKKKEKEKKKKGINGDVKEKKITFQRLMLKLNSTNLDTDKCLDNVG